MTNKFLKKQVLASCAILALGAMVVFVWVAFSQGAFKTQRQYSSVNVTLAVPVQSGGTFNRTRHKGKICIYFKGKVIKTFNGKTEF